MSYQIFDISIKDRFDNTNQNISGGKVLVALASAPYEAATLYNPDTFASLTNPVSINYGRIRFAVATGTTGLTSPIGVALYGITGGGQSIFVPALYTGRPQTIRIDSGRRDNCLILPFSYAQGVVASVVDLGIDLPTGALVGPYCSIDVKAIDATETLDVGLLASESGGDEDGFLAAVSIGTLGVVRGQFAATATAGALVRESQDSGAALTPRPHVVATAVSVTWTITSGSDTGKGRILIPYTLGVTPTS